LPRLPSFFVCFFFGIGSSLTPFNRTVHPTARSKIAATARQPR
jgi:hypothetical protein